MNSIEALEWAAEYCERNKIFQIPVNPKGYPESGMKPPDASERVRLIKELAATVTDPVPGVTVGSDQASTLVDKLSHAISVAVTNLNLATFNKDPMEYDSEYVGVAHRALKKLLEEIEGD